MFAARKTPKYDHQTAMGDYELGPVGGRYDPINSSNSSRDKGRPQFIIAFTVILIIVY